MTFKVSGGQASIALKAKGALLATPDLPLAQSPDVTIQLRGGDVLGDRPPGARDPQRRVPVRGHGSLIRGGARAARRLEYAAPWCRPEHRVARVEPLVLPARLRRSCRHRRHYAVVVRARDAIRAIIAGRDAG